jgi:hypothetical protein
MPLRDHFHSPLDDVHSSDELHGMWPAMMVRQLSEVLPKPYFAAPSVHLGTIFEVDVATYRNLADPQGRGGEQGSGVAVAAYAPPRPTLTMEPRLPRQDVYEVRIYDNRRDRRLVAAIELVSPSNKDRPENRASFVAKLAALLSRGVCVSVVDVVNLHEVNLYEQLLDWWESSDPGLGDEPPAMSALTLRLRPSGIQRLLDSWYYPLRFGQPLPTLPIWLHENLAVSLNLEESYEETCRLLRIA